jgi:hypothetical protein
MDDGPFRILGQESSYCRGQSRTAVFAAFAKDLGVMQHNPTTDSAGVAMEFIGQLFVQKTNLESAMSFVRQILCIAAGTDDAIDESFREQLVCAGLEKELHEVSGTYCHHLPICIWKVFRDDTLISMASAADSESQEDSAQA